MSPRHGSLAKERCRSDRETHRFAEALSARQPGSKQTEHGWGQTRLSLTQRGRVLPAKKQRPTNISNPQSSPQTEWSCMSCRYFGNIKPLIPLQVTNVDISASHLPREEQFNWIGLAVPKNLKRREIFPNPATAN